MHYVLVLMAVALVAILVAIVFVAIGRGGEMAQFPNDYAPPEFGALAATDVALLRPPTALWGYHMQATDEALNSIALAISDRDVRIASLERQLADLRGSMPMAGNAQPPAPDQPPAGNARPAAPPGSGTGMTAATGLAGGFGRGRAPAHYLGPAGPAGAAGPPASRARPTEPSPGEGAAGAEGGGAERTGMDGAGGAGNAGPAGNAQGLDDPAEGGPGAHASAHDSGAAWSGWSDWPGAPAQPPGPPAETQPEPPRSRPQDAASPRQQPDDEETW